MSERRGDWIQTATGRQFWPLDPRPEDVFIEDIAHHLANMCRFTGATRQFYSVAEHSVRASRVVPSEYALAGLLHDASEAYLVDLPRPLKRSADFAVAYLRAEVAVSDAIGQRYGLPMGYQDWPDVKHADNVLLVTEKRDLMAPSTTLWKETGVVPLVDKIVPWKPRVAHFEFLSRFYELTHVRLDHMEVQRVVDKTRMGLFQIERDLQQDFRCWCGLSVWGADLSRVTLDVVVRRRSKVYGSADVWRPISGERHRRLTVQVNAAYGLGDARATILHELTHISLYRRMRGHPTWRYHNARWRKLFLAGVEAATGIVICAETSKEADDLVAEALSRRERRFA